MKKILVILVAFFSCFGAPNTFAVDEAAQAQYEKYMKQINDAYEAAMQRFQQQCESDTTKKWTGEECVDKTKKDIRQEKRNNKKDCESDPAKTWINGECKNKDEANQKKLCEQDGKHKYDGTRCNEKTTTELCDDQKGIMVDGNCITEKSCEGDGEHTWDAKTKTCNDKEKSKLQQRKEAKEKTKSNSNEKTNKDIRQENRAKKADNKTKRQEQRTKKADEREQAKQEKEKQKQCEKQGGYVDNNGNCITKEICEQDGNKTFTGSDCIEKPQETPPAPANTDDNETEQNAPVKTPKKENNVADSVTPAAQPKNEPKSTVADTNTKIKLSVQNANLASDKVVGLTNNKDCYFTLGRFQWMSVSEDMAKKDDYHAQDYKKCNDLNMKEVYAHFPYGTLKLKAVRDNSTYDCTCTAISFKPKSSNTEESLNGESIVIPYTTADESRFRYDSYCIETCGAVLLYESAIACKRRAKLFGMSNTNCPVDTTNEETTNTSSESKNTSTESEIIQIESNENSWKAIGGGIELDGSCAVQYDTGMIDASKKSSCKKLKLKKTGQWEFKSDKHGLIKGSAKCESETCFCQINMINNNYTSTAWVKKNMFDDYTNKDRENKNCQNSCVYSCMYGLETDSDYQNRLFNNKVQKLSEANPAKAGKTFKALSKENFCYASRVTADNKLAQINEKKQCSALKKEQWVVDFDYGTVKGTSMCLNTKGDTKGFKKIINSATEKPGDFCWCKITQFTPTGGTLQNINAYSVYLGTNNISCPSECARQCGFNLLGKPDWRKIILNSELD